MEFTKARSDQVLRRNALAGEVLHDRDDALPTMLAFIKELAGVRGPQNYLGLQEAQAVFPNNLDKNSSILDAMGAVDLEGALGIASLNRLH